MTSGDAVGRGLLLASLPPGRTGPLAGPTCQQQQCWRGPWRLGTCQAQAEPGGQAWGSGEVTRFLGALGKVAPHRGTCGGSGGPLTLPALPHSDDTLCFLAAFLK